MINLVHHCKNIVDFLHSNKSSLLYVPSDIILEYFHTDDMQYINTLNDAATCPQAFRVQYIPQKM